MFDENFPFNQKPIVMWFLTYFSKKYRHFDFKRLVMLYIVKETSQNLPTITQPRWLTSQLKVQALGKPGSCSGPPADDPSVTGDFQCPRF